MRKIDFRRIMFLIIFLMGLGLMSFPIISQFYYYNASHQKINEFKAEVLNLSSEEKEQRINLAKAYNASLNFMNITIKDPYNSEEKEQGRNEYGRMLKVKEQIGHVVVPKISQDLPIYTGTSEDVLQKGVGHLEGTSLPVGGESTHTVLSAHRGLPNAQLFTNLDKLEKGDIFYIHNLKETLAYKVEEIKIIEPTEIENLKIIVNKDYATLLTCTPYMINSHRLLVRGERIAYNPEEESKLLEKASRMYLLYVVGIVIVFIILILSVIMVLRRKNEK